MYLNILDSIIKIYKKIQNKKIIIFGAGSGGENVLFNLLQTQLKPAYFVDNSQQNDSSGKFLTYDVLNPKFLLKENKEEIAILIASTYNEEITIQLKEMGFEKNEHFYSVVFDADEKKSPTDIIEMPVENLETRPEQTEDILFHNKEFTDIYNVISQYTMVPPDSLYSLYKSVLYIEKNKIKGNIVECGVWKGGCCMLIALVLKKMGNTSRKIFMYDTYEGMTEPTSKDVNNAGDKALDCYKEMKETNTFRNGITNWAECSLDIVKENLKKVDYPEENIIFVKGKIEDTIPQIMPDEISLLRLDTDWYESTLHELKYLYPLLSKNGVLIQDDYYCWLGSKNAVDEYFEKENISLLFHKIATNIIAIKNF